MQITITGKLKLSELRQAIFEKLGELEDEFAVNHFKGATLYFTPTNEHGDEVILKKLGKPVNKILSNGPYKSAAEEFQI